VSSAALLSLWPTRFDTRWPMAPVSFGSARFVEYEKVVYDTVMKSDACVMSRLPSEPSEIAS